MPPTTPSAEALAADCCKECGGAGHVRAMTSHLGPDDYEYDETCAVCAGSGAASLKEVIESLPYFERPLFPNGALVPYVKRSEVLKVIAARAALSEEPKAQAQAAELSKDDIAYPRDVFQALLSGNSPYAFYLFQWVPYQTDAKRWRLKMQHDVRTFDGREAFNIWPNASSCGPFRDDEVEFIRISKSQFGYAWQDPRPDRPELVAAPAPSQAQAAELPHFAIINAICRLTLVNRNEAVVHQIDRLVEALPDGEQRQKLWRLLQDATKGDLDRPTAPRCRLVPSQVQAHDIIKTGDVDAHPATMDRNGEVVLSQCRRCGKAEAELDEPCTPSPEARDRAADKAAMRAVSLESLSAPEARETAEPRRPSGDEERTQPWYDLAWASGATGDTSFDGDELNSLTFTPGEFEEFCEKLLAAGVETEKPAELLGTLPHGAKLYAAPVSQPEARETAEPVCERCGESQAAHTGTYWCDNQSFTAPQAAERPAEPVGALLLARSALSIAADAFSGKNTVNALPIVEAAIVQVDNAMGSIDTAEPVARAVVFEYEGTSSSWNSAHVDWADGFLAKLKPGEEVMLYAAPVSQAEPSTSHEEKGQG